MYFESAVILAPIILLLNYLVAKRIGSLEEAIKSKESVYLTKQELVSNLDSLSRKLDGVEYKLDLAKLFALKESEISQARYENREEEDQCGK